MRGKGVVDVLVSEPLGITPACAGKSLWSPLLLILAEDHPRVCGEKDLELYRIMTTKGSPPRVRGKAGAAGPCTGGAGITPACAGKSCPPQAPTFTRQDHPRACGEKGLLCPAVHLHGGSPPRVRGKASTNGLYPTFAGITPAYAGKRIWNSTALCPPRDHPRVCGEKLSTTSTDIHPAGSPPRMRGKAVVLKWSCRETRITPACAGKS